MPLPFLVWKVGESANIGAERIFPMVYSDLLSELLGIDKLRVMRTEIDSAEQITLFVESGEEVAVCPECKHLSLQVHGLCEKQLIHDLSYGERHC